MIVATSHDLLGYLADGIAHAERFGGTILPPYHADEVAWARDGDSLVMRIGMRLPAGYSLAASRAHPVGALASERWA